jgi:hypothetical protein
MHPPHQKRRWRFRFSLRTLIAAVLVYATLYLVTLRVGGAALTQQFADKFRERGDTVSVGSDGRSIRVEPQWDSWPDAIRGKAIAVAPFVLIWRWEYEGSNVDPVPEPHVHFCIADKCFALKQKVNSLPWFWYTYDSGGCR